MYTIYSYNNKMGIDVYIYNYIKEVGICSRYSICVQDTCVSAVDK